MRAWFDTSHFNTVALDIQIEFLKMVIKEDLMNAIKHRFQDHHSYRDLMGFAEEEYVLYNTQFNNLQMLLNLTVWQKGL